MKLVKRNKAVSVSIAAAAAILLAVGVFSYVRIALERDRAVSSEQQAVAARQKERETALAAARRFAMQAIRAAETGRLDEAERRARDADDVALNSPWGMYARAMFASAENNYKIAADRFREALKLDPEHVESKAGLAEAISKQGDLEQAVALAGNVGSINDWRALVKVGQTLYHADRLKECQAPLKRALELMEKQQDASVQQRAETVKEVQEQIDTAFAKVACEGFEGEIRKLPPEEQLKRVQAKLNEINGSPVSMGGVTIRNGEWVTADLINQQNLRFLYPLKGIPLRKLSIHDTSVKDLSPLEGMPLESIILYRTRVRDLSPLAGMPLKCLDCGIFSDISDLSPLEGMPLEELSIQGTKVDDIGPLRGLPLKKLLVKGSPITDLRPLQDMSLLHLECNDCPVSDLTPLQGMPLKNLSIPGTRVMDLTPLKAMQLEEFYFTPKTITKGIQYVREMKSIRAIGLEGRRRMRPEEFWKRYDAGEFNK
ncbi:MAG: Internalin-A precursor [Planctomycetes bacterium ADurb.Bin126]|nr:MAG: Internalin-A precursor [Planctomycetes bacterium ADurb.Bin126]